MKTKMKKILQGEVTHEVKVTRIKGHGYGVRVLINGQINQEGRASTQAEIGPVARARHAVGRSQRIQTGYIGL